MSSSKWKLLLNSKTIKKVLSKLSTGEGSPSFPKGFKTAGWIVSSWSTQASSKFQSLSASPWGQQFTRTIRQLNKHKTQPQPAQNSSNNPFNPKDFTTGQIPSGRFTAMDKYYYILKPFAFTAFVGTSSIVACTIWQYEDYQRSVTTGRFSLTNLRRSVFGDGSGPSASSSSERNISPSSSREVVSRVENWWAGLSSAEKIFWPICGLNGLVWCAWRIPGMAPTMVKYFSATPVSRSICLPMLLSTFSHYSLLHLCANMFVLHSFIPAAVQILGKEQFVAMYLTAGTVSSLGSHLYKLFIRNNTPSLGASGAIMGILGLVCTRMPEIQLGIIFLPGVQFTADSALKCILAIDAAGLFMGWRFMDHAAHLSGCLFGVAFSHYGGQTFWAFRDFVMTEWHKYRTKPGEGGIS